MKLIEGLQKGTEKNLQKLNRQGSKEIDEYSGGFKFLKSTKNSVRNIMPFEVYTENK